MTTTEKQHSRAASEHVNMAHDISRASKLDLERFGVEYRKGKTLFDVVEALRKCRKEGFDRWETEVAMLAASLVAILKPSRRRIRKLA